MIGALPPELFKQAKLLEYDLALRHSDTGQFKDVFLGAHQFPILFIGAWLLDDLDALSGSDRDELERDLFISALLLAARAHLREAIRDPDSFSDEGHLQLVEAFDKEIARRLGEASIAARPGDDPGERFAAPAIRLASATLRYLHRSELEPTATRMLSALASAFQIGDELAAMHRDLLAGRRTSAIEAVARKAGIPLDPWPEPNIVLGAMVVTQTLPELLESALDHVRESRRVAEELRLPTFIAYLSDAELRFDERRKRVSGREHRSGTGPVVYLSEPTPPKALAMAEGSLLADTSFRESWELHREGMFGAPEVASRFPAALILEILCRLGHELASDVDAFFAFTDANRFRYYDHPWSDVDTDTIGVYLRLLPYGSLAWGQTHAMSAALDCLEREVRAAGAVPVWLKECVGPDEERPPVMALGEGCGTVAAHLLLGLIDAGRLPDVVEIGARHLLGRICEVGLAASVNYPPLYALAIFLRLAARLPDAADALTCLRGELEGRRHTPVTGAQDAALLAIACYEAGAPDLIDAAWITAMLKRQRFDGSWLGEPFAAAPNRGRYVTWYSSTLLTTAFCYDALKRYSTA